ncbi:MAG: hypothetical protein JWP41_1685, partial [Ramlibacter sp.]|nr:hypothetical protein [Ramlibacter sp.]
ARLLQATFGKLRARGHPAGAGR